MIWAAQEKVPDVLVWNRSSDAAEIPFSKRLTDEFLDKAKRCKTKPMKECCQLYKARFHKDISVAFNSILKPLIFFW